MSEIRYIEMAYGSVSNRNIIINKNERLNYIKKAQLEKAELYFSVFEYDNNIIEHFKTYKSVKSYKNILYPPQFIPLDIDKGSDTDEFVLERAKALIRKLITDWDFNLSEIITYYSGRGYHIYIPNYFKFEPSEYVHNEIKFTIKEYFPEVDLSIYNHSSIIRAPYTYNSKTNRFKVPIDNLLDKNVEDILAISQNGQNMEILNHNITIDLNKDFSNRIIKSQVDRERVQYTHEATRVITCMQHLFNRGSQVGQRHIEALRLVSAWRSQGLTMNACIILLKNWAPTFETNEIEKIVKDVYDKGYKYGCNDIVMSRYCDPKCIFYQNKNYIPDIKTNADIDNILNEWITTFPYKQHINLKDIFKLKNDYKIYESEMVMFIGDTKIGKSTLVQNIVANIPDKKILYLSLENGIILDTRRLLQIKLNCSKEDVVNNLYKNKQLFSQLFPNFYISDNSIDLKALRKIISETEAFIVVIDTVDQINTKAIDYTQKTQELALAIRDLTREMKVIVFMIHHINKSSAIDQNGIRKTINIHSGKGSSALEQKADKIISIEGERDKELRVITSLGARDEHPFKTVCEFNKDTFKLNIIGDNTNEYTFQFPDVS